MKCFRSSLYCSGLRVATVIAIGTATIAAAIGAGGLGVYIFRGLRGGGSNNTLVLAGALPAALMALGADFALGWVERRLAPGARRAGRAIGGLIAAAGLIVIIVAAVFFFSHNASCNMSASVVGRTMEWSVRCPPPHTHSDETPLRVPRRYPARRQ